MGKNGVKEIMKEYPIHIHLFTSDLRLKSFGGRSKPLPYG